MIDTCAMLRVLLLVGGLMGVLVTEAIAQSTPGANRWRIRVPWAADATVDAVRAFGVEMVHVPTGAFELGTTRSLTGRRESTSRNWLADTPPAPLSALFQVDPDGEDLYGGTYPVTPHLRGRGQLLHAWWQLLSQPHAVP